MTELDFDQDRARLIDYVVDKICLMESGDDQAISFIEYLWDVDPELLEDSYEAYYFDLEGKL
jgi:hypothetical protein